MLPRGRNSSWERSNYVGRSVPDLYPSAWSINIGCLNKDSGIGNSFPADRYTPEEKLAVWSLATPHAIISRSHILVALSKRSQITRCTVPQKLTICPLNNSLHSVPDV